jgi:pimeloyl-ACP methyl ester carboxylesterase
MGIKQAPNAAMKALIGYDGSREGMKGLLEALIVDKSRITDALIDDRQSTVERPGVWDSFRRMAAAIDYVKTDPVLASQTDWRETLPVLTQRIPTMILWGKEDPFALPETGQALADMLPDARMEWVDGAGHQVQTDQPEVTAAIIRDFLDG